MQFLFLDSILLGQAVHVFLFFKCEGKSFVKGRMMTFDIKKILHFLLLFFSDTFFQLYSSTFYRESIHFFDSSIV